MLPGPTNVPERVTRAMFTPTINHRSKDFVKLYTDVIEKTQKVFQTSHDIIALTASGTGAVEAVSILGGEELPVDKWGIDVCIAAGQKAMAAPPGISPISISPKAKKYMIANPPPTFYFNLARYFKYYDDTKETPFTPALPLLYAFREALDIILEEGMEARIKRHRVCSDAFYSGLSAMGLSPFAKQDARSTVVIPLNYLHGLDATTFRS